MSYEKVFNKQSNLRNSFVKQFYNESRNPVLTWKYSEVNVASESDSNSYENVLTPVKDDIDVFVPKKLIVGGSIENPSDLRLKTNIEDLSLDLANKLVEVVPKQYIFKKDIDCDIHYGFIAQEVEEKIPNLVKNIETPIDGKIKSLNYLEMIPLLLLKIKDLQTQIDELKSK